MRYATFLAGGRRQVGIVLADGLHVQALALPPRDAERGVLTLVEMSSRGEAMPAADGAPIPLSSVQLDAPIPLPRRNIWCVGRNYHAHAKELQTSVFKDNSTTVDGWPIVFTKVPECVVGPFDDVQLPTGISQEIDYEAELLVIIGKGGKNISKTNALKHIWGYSVVNDVTARDVQMRHHQWDMGKSFDTFCPMGPWAITAEEFDGTQAVVRCWVNGELRQEGHASQLIFDIPTLIETISRGITLYPGDLIATGTPAGVGMGMKPPRYLKAGDKVRIDIEHLGMMENTMVAGDA